jgi:hypothetical protein
MTYRFLEQNRATARRRVKKRTIILSLVLSANSPAAHPSTSIPEQVSPVSDNLVEFFNRRLSSSCHVFLRAPTLAGYCYRTRLQDRLGDSRREVIDAYLRRDPIEGSGGIIRK